MWWIYVLFVMVKCVTVLCQCGTLLVLMGDLIESKWHLIGLNVALDRAQCGT